MVEISTVVSEEDSFLISSPFFSNLHNRQTFKVHKKSCISIMMSFLTCIMLKSSSLCLYSSNLGTFWLKIEQIWPFEEISIFSNDGHLGYRTALTDTILRGTHPGTIPARFGLIWFSGFRGKDLNVIFYQNMPNLHNRYKSAERKISKKTQNIC